MAVEVGHAQQAAAAHAQQPQRARPNSRSLGARRSPSVAFFRPRMSFSIFFRWLANSPASSSIISLLQQAGAKGRQVRDPRQLQAVGLADRQLAGRRRQLRLGRPHRVLGVATKSRSPPTCHFCLACAWQGTGGAGVGGRLAAQRGPACRHTTDAMPAWRAWRWQAAGRQAGPRARPNRLHSADRAPPPPHLLRETPPPCAHGIGRECATAAARRAAATLWLWGGCTGCREVRVPREDGTALAAL